ncbi:hypothetical protein P153DRAFT_401277 [Dothidotthia symphoricarpi CBS 119687]|uniref:2EXR domain-containing protein n=1 Tax=Dothidotthia symphoricarpi CBS 119687 TaxID=1392245 RepID=A0A6A5ZYU1_9PLEO|nr:uncharacterized protein P153DRAFT_401277 [Dothidotthia symphoricarpi CBS 119687]KAF2124185.1 hypothetical protein P153DRAFT_401277 [Dothidotthia symphoricarpi CBS 119687]
MSATTFPAFSRLPTELRLAIWGRCNPTTAHQGRCNPPTARLTIREEDYEVLSVSAPPPLFSTSKEARRVAQSAFGVRDYPIWTADDWADLVFDPATTPLEIVVEVAGDKKKGTGLNVTWTELAIILGDALPAATRVHVVCRDLNRLERLWMQHRAGDVVVGEAVSEEVLFSAEALEMDREVQRGLHRGLVVTASGYTMGELAEREGEEEVFEWRVEEDEEEVVVVVEEELCVEKSGDVLTLALLVELEEEVEGRWTDAAVREWVDGVCDEEA